MGERWAAVIVKRAKEFRADADEASIRIKDAGDIRRGPGVVAISGSDCMVKIYRALQNKYAPAITVTVLIGVGGILCDRAAADRNASVSRIVSPHPAPIRVRGIAAECYLINYH